MIIGLLKFLFTKFVMAVLLVLLGFLGILGFRYWETSQPVETVSPSSSQVNYMEMDCWTTARGCSVGVVDSSVPPEVPQRRPPLKKRLDVPPEVLERRVGVEDVNR